LGTRGAPADGLGRPRDRDAALGHRSPVSDQAQCIVSGDGVRVRFDVASVLERGTGSVEVHNRLPLDSSVLSQLPAANGPVTLSHATEALLNPWLSTHGGGGPRTGTG
jgi:hypothetical protein